MTEWRRQKRRTFKETKKFWNKKWRAIKVIKNKTSIKWQIDLFIEDLSSEVVALLKEIIDIGDNFDYDKLSVTVGNRKIYGLKNFKTLEKLVKDINNVYMKIDEAEPKQNKFAKWLHELIAYPAMGSKYIGLKESASKYLRKNIRDNKKLCMSLRMEYHHSVKRMVWKLIVVISDQIF